MRYSILLLLSSLLVPLQAQQLTQNIRGVVIDAFTEQPLPGANVVLTTMENKGASTDLNGEFRLTDIPVGQVSITISFIGFKPVILNNLRLNSGKEMFLKIKLEEDVETLESIVVSSEGGNEAKHKPKNELATLSARSFSVDETRKYAGSLGDPGTMAANFAGVNGANSDRNDIVIRGNSPSFLLWRMHGLNIPNPNHFAALGTSGGAIGILNNNLLDDSDFFTSAFPAEYGNAIGGVFDLVMRNGNKEKYEFVGQMGFNGIELGAEGPLKDRSSFLVNYRYSTLAFFKVLGLGAGLQGAVPEYQDVSFKLDFPTKSAGRFSIFGIGGISNINLLEENKKLEPDSDLGTPDNTDVKFGSGLAVVGLEHVYFFNKNTTLNTSLGWSGDLFDQTVDTINVSGDNSKQFMNIRRATNSKISFNTKFKKKIDASKNLSMGLIADVYNVSYLDSSQRSVFTDSVFGATRADINEGGLALLQPYIQWKHQLSNKASYYIGLNAEYFSLNQNFAIEPRLGFIYQPGPKSRLSIGYGLHSQVQSLQLYFVNEVENGQILKTKTNQDLTFTRAHHAVLGYDWTVSRNLRFKTEAYYQYLFDVPVEKTTSYYSVLNVGASFNENFEPNLINGGAGRNYGIEFTLEKFLADNYYYLLTASFFNSEYQGSDDVWRNSAFNNNYIVNLLGGYELPLSSNITLDFNIRLNAAGGRRKLQVDEAATRQNGYITFREDNAYEKSFEDYFRLDFKVGVFWNVMQGFSQQFSVDMQNITNRRNIFSERYDLSTSSIKQTFLRGLFPVFTYRALF